MNTEPKEMPENENSRGRLQAQASAKPGKVSTWCTLFILLTAVPSFADVYRCVSADGTIRFSDQPCGEQAEVAFEAYDSCVDDAVVQDIFPRDKPSRDVPGLRWGLESHADAIAQCIAPRDPRNHLFLHSAGGHYFNAEIDWKIDIFLGPEEFKRKWEINIYYKGKKGDRISVWLDSITIKKDKQPFDPPTMENVRKLRKTGTGEWKTL